MPAFEQMYEQLDKDFRFSIERAGISEEELQVCAEGRTHDDFRTAIIQLMANKRKAIRDRMSSVAKIEYALNIANDLVTGRHTTWDSDQRLALQELIREMTIPQKELAILELQRNKPHLTAMSIRSALDEFIKEN